MRSLLEAVAGRCSVKKFFSEISQNSQKSTSTAVSFLIKLQIDACKFIKKETLAQVFSCEFLRTPFPRERFRWLILAYSYTHTQMIFLLIYFQFLGNCLYRIFFQRDIVNCERKLSNRHKIT